MTPTEMTSASLLFWIVLGISLQLALWLSISFWRHWGEYQVLRAGLGSSEGSAVPQAEFFSNITEPVSTPAWNGFRSFRVDDREIEDGTRSVCSFYLVPVDKLPLPSFKPGQFLTFRLDIPKPDGSGTEQITRCYSLSDAPQADHYRVSIKRVPPPPKSDHPPGRSSNFFHDHVQVGTTLQVRAPSGHFYLEPASSPIVL
ncbi:MAG: FAD-binding oxidoreductase, partial [Patescibacteria group bacterium]